MRRFSFPAFLLLLWLVLAWRSPDVTYHLAPPLIAGAFAGLIGGARGAVLAFFGTAGVIGLLAVTGLLAGPSLLPVGGAAFEAAAFAAAGAALGGLLSGSKP